MPFKDTNRRNPADKLGIVEDPSSPIKRRTINIASHKTSISAFLLRHRLGF